MSNPLGSADIEDVVSSIRRLVSPDGRPRTRDLAHDRLILTPALRVVPDPEPEPEPELEPELEPEPLMEAEWEDEIWPEPELTLAEAAAEIEDAELVVAEVGTFAVSPENGAETAEAAIPFVAHRRDDPPVSDDAVIAPDLLAGEVGADPALSNGAADDLDEDEDAGAIGSINEDVLHEIVRDLIREELQGALGERITRNVRKLVRAEINRALASRVLD